MSFSNVRYLILDEADRMLEMGFENDIRKIVTQFGMPEKTQRQTLMFSATFPAEIQKLAREYLNDYLFLAVGSVGGTNLDIKQEVLDVQGTQKRSVLMEILGQSGSIDCCLFLYVAAVTRLLSFIRYPHINHHGESRKLEKSTKKIKIPVK